MNIEELKSHLSGRVKELEKEWHKEADKERDAYDFPSYMRTIQIDAEINALMRLITMLS